METWPSVGQLLDEASPDELRVLLQHYLEVIELRPSPNDSRRGAYVLRLFPEVRPLDGPAGPKADGTSVARPDGGAVLAEAASVCGEVE